MCYHLFIWAAGISFLLKTIAVVQYFQFLYPKSAAKWSKVESYEFSIFKSWEKWSQKKRSFLEGKFPKMPKKILKIFIVPKRSLGHTDPIDTYKGHILAVIFT